MCDILIVALAIDSKRVPSGSIRTAVTEVQTLIARARLGAFFESTETRSREEDLERRPSEELSHRYRNVLIHRLKEMVKPRSQDTILFELTSDPSAACICNATWNAYEPPDPHPDQAPIVRFLTDVFALPYVVSSATFYGPSGIADPERALEWGEISEPAEAFVKHFFTQERGNVIGIDVSGFFQIRGQASPN